jgi:signal peptidase I
MHITPIENTHHRVRTAASWVGFAALLAIVWWFVVPAGVPGGRTHYIVVHGHSMEPMLHTGDLAVVRDASSFHVGELVVVHVYGGTVIHRIVSGSPTTGWTTKGDNNSWLDPWIVANNEIVGKYVFDIGRFGSALTWSREQPLGFGALCALCVMIPYLPFRRRRLAPELRAALAAGHPEPRSGGTHELGTFITSTVCMVLSLVVAVMLLAQHHLFTMPGLMSLFALTVSGSSTLVLGYWVLDGRGREEPLKSLAALSGRLVLVPVLPDVNARLVHSATELRSIAEKYRLPVLHHVNEETAMHEFLVITVKAGSFVWLAPTGTSPTPSPSTVVRFRTRDRDHGHRTAA